MGKDSDEWLGSLDYDDLLDVARKGTPEVGGSQVNRKTAARTEIDRRRAEAQLEKERKLTKKEKDEAIREAEKKEKARPKILRLLEKINKNISPIAFANLTGMVKSTVRRELAAAYKRGDIVKVKRGIYRFK